MNPNKNSSLSHLYQIKKQEIEIEEQGEELINQKLEIDKQRRIIDDMKEDDE